MKKSFFLIIGVLFLFSFFYIPKNAFAITCGDPCESDINCQGATNGCTECRDASFYTSEWTGSIYKTCQEPLEYETRHEQIPDIAAPLTEEKKEDKKSGSIIEDVTTEDLAAKINNMLPKAMGLGGIIAFILIIFGAFQIILSGGNPDRVKAGKEMITSAIAGLLLIIFSVFILRLIGYDILKIPGFDYFQFGGGQPGSGGASGTW